MCIKLAGSSSRLTELKHEEPSRNVPTLETNTTATTARTIFQVDEGHHSKQTAAKYRTNFRHFLEFIRIHNLDVLLDLGKEAIQELVIKYTRSLRDNADKKYSRNTVNNRISAILYFFDNNDIELNKRKIRRHFPSDESTNDDRPYTTEEIQRILSVCDLRTRVMVLLMASSGMRIGALHSMQIGDLSVPDSAIIKISPTYRIQVYARTRDKYYTFCTPECAKAIDDYLDYRKRCGELLKDESPLFRRQFNRFSINKPLPISQPSVMKAIDDALKRSGVKTSESMRSHAFRKRFMSICEQKGMKSINVKMLLGHDIGVSGHYYRPPDSELLEDYMIHAADALTIDPRQKLQQENQQLKKDYLAELGDLRQEFNDMKDMLIALKNKGTQKKLVNEFFDRTNDELQDQELGPTS